MSYYFVHPISIIYLGQIILCSHAKGIVQIVVTGSVNLDPYKSRILKG